MKPRHRSTWEQLEPASRETAPARRSRASVRSKKGVKVETSVTINRAPEELFSFWRDFRNVPTVMEHVESVECYDDRRSHWRMRRPGGKCMEWDADIINERPGELIAWRTVEGSDVRHAGTIRFELARTGRGTKVKLALEYEPVGGKLATAIAKLFRHSPEADIRADLRRFKELMEKSDAVTRKATVERRRAATNRALADHE